MLQLQPLVPSNWTYFVVENLPYHGKLPTSSHTHLSKVVRLFGSAHRRWHKLLKHERGCSEVNTNYYRLPLHPSLGSRWLTLPIFQSHQGTLNLPEWRSDL